MKKGQRGRRRHRSPAVSPRHGEDEPAADGSCSPVPGTPLRTSPASRVTFGKIIGRVTRKRKHSSTNAFPKHGRKGRRGRRHSSSSSDQDKPIEEEDPTKLFCICKTIYDINRYVPERLRKYVVR